MRSIKLAFLVAVVLGSVLASGQSVPDLEQGMKAYGSYHGGDLDHISLSNGNLLFRADLFSYSQRGDLAYPVVLQYNNKNFGTFQPSCPPGTKLGTVQCPFRMSIVFGPNPLASNNVSLGASATIGFDGLPGVVVNNVNSGLSFDNNQIFVPSNSVLMPDGSLHQLVTTNSGLTTTDGSGYSAPSGGGYSMDRNGTKYGWTGAPAEDRNGNLLSLAGTNWTDTLGRQFAAAPGPGPLASPPLPSTAPLGSCPTLNYVNQPVVAAYSWSLPTYGGGTIPLVLCYTSVYVRTNFLAPAGANGPNLFDVNKPFSMLQSVVLPDNTHWAFQYDAADPNNANSFAFGDLLKVTLPIGGSLTYTWGMSNGGCTSGFSRSVQTRTVDASDGTGPHTWTYSNGMVTDPAGNDTVHTFTGLGGSCSQYETQTQYYQGSHTGGTLLKTVTTDYQYTVNPWDPAVISSSGVQSLAESVTNVLPIHVTTTLPNGLVSRVETDYDNALAYHGPLDGITSNTWSCPLDNGCSPIDQVTNPPTNYVGSYGKAIAIREYDWGQGAPGPLLRRTVNSYQWQTGPNAAAYLSNNFLDLVSTVTTYDGAGNVVAMNANGYDEYPLVSSGVSTTLHDATPLNATIRGNRTTVSHWLNTSNTFVPSHATYYDTGEIQTSTDPLGHTSTHLYDVAYQGAYSTQTCSPTTAGVTHCVSGTYDFNTGLLTSFTSENATTQASGNTPGDAAHTSTFSYESNFWRMTQAQAPPDPDPANGGARATTMFTFSAPGVLPVSVNRLRSITNALIDSATSYFDGVGRPYQSDHVTPGGTAEVLTTFDALGHVATVTNPYYVGSSHSTDPTYGVSSSVYDALGRVTTAIPQDGTATSNNVTTDYSNFPTVTVTDQAGKQRRSRTDALGRLVEVDEPGGGVSGASANGSVAIAGSLQTAIVGAHGGSSGTGSITISGAEQSATSTGTKATGWFTVSGLDAWVQPFVCLDTCVKGPKIFDSGTISVAVNGVTYSTTYGQNSTASSLANALAAQMTGSPVAASSPGTGATSNLTAGTAGPNYALSWSATTNDPTDFGGASFGVTLSGAALTGGVAPVTTYDAGTVTATVNGFVASASYNQTVNNTPALLASALAAALNAPSSPVTAAASGTTINLTSKVQSGAANYALSTAVSYDSGHFSGASFAASKSGAALTGGTDAFGGTTVYDSGTVNLSVGGFTASAPYGQSSNSNGAQVASALAAALNVAASPVTATASGSSVAMIYKTLGTAGNTAVSVTSTTGQPANFTTGSFNGTATLANGVNTVPGTLATPYVTVYGYDPLGNLLRVDQKGSAPADSTQWRTRTFTYDSLSRLLTAQNPESGTITYAYDLDGNLLQKTSPLANQTGAATQTVSFCYDELHRVTGKGYGVQSCPLASPVVTYTYDVGANAKGKLTSLTDPAGTATFSYDSLGRLTSETRVISGISKSLSYTYNLDGSMKSLTYPSGATVTYTPWNNGTVAVNVPQDAKDLANGINYATSGWYNAPGSLVTLVNGNSGTFAGITNTFSYNQRLQPVNMSASAPSQTVFSIGYDFHLGAGNNGNVFGITNYKDNARNQAFTYDALNRLTSAQNAGTNCAVTVIGGKAEYWGDAYAYDAWGNLLQKTVTKCGAENLSVFAAVNNQLTGGYTYDTAGNMMHDATSGLNYTYDQENRITGAGGYTYTYDGDGNRVKKSNGTGASAGTLYWYMTPGIVAESDQAGVLKSEYVFFGGERVARRDLVAPTGVSYYFSDRLKTASVITDAAGNIKSESDYYPWGGELQFVANDSNHYKFTGKERDAETGLDLMGARYYANSLGRFTSTDPLNVLSLQFLKPKQFAQFIANPQNWNAYSYSLNDPVNKLDPDGFLTIIIPGTNWKAADWNENSAFYKQVERTFGEKPKILDWTGGNTKEARAAAKATLDKLIKDHPFAKGEKLNIVAHSHGGNIAFLESKSTPHNFDNLVTLGTPMRDDYSPTPEHIGNFVNVYSTTDKIQINGGHGDKFCYFQGECGPAGRTSPFAQNVDSGIKAGSIESHSLLWQNQTVWTKSVEPKVKK